MTNQKDTMPDEIYACDMAVMSDGDVIGKFSSYPNRDNKTKYTRADKSMVRDILKANQMQAEKIRDLNGKIEELQFALDVLECPDAVLKQERDLLARYIDSSTFWMDEPEPAQELARNIVEGDK